MLVAGAGGLGRLDVASGITTPVAPAGATFETASPDLSTVIYVAGTEVYRVVANGQPAQVSVTVSARRT